MIYVYFKFRRSTQLLKSVFAVNSVDSGIILKFEIRILNKTIGLLLIIDFKKERKVYPCTFYHHHYYHYYYYYYNYYYY